MVILENTEYTSSFWNKGTGIIKGIFLPIVFAIYTMQIKNGIALHVFHSSSSRSHLASYERDQPWLCPYYSVLTEVAHDYAGLFRGCLTYPHKTTKLTSAAAKVLLRSNDLKGLFFAGGTDYWLRIIAHYMTASVLL